MKKGKQKMRPTMRRISVCFSQVLQFKVCRSDSISGTKVTCLSLYHQFFSLKYRRIVVKRLHNNPTFTLANQQFSTSKPPLYHKQSATS